MDFFLSSMTFTSVSSFSEKLPRRFAMVDSSGGAADSFRRPHCIPECPFRSTATKLVRTLDSGRGDALLLPANDGAGERPLLGGGDVVESSLFSNMARRLRTPPLPERPWLVIACIVAQQAPEDGSVVQPTMIDL